MNATADASVVTPKQRLNPAIARAQRILSGIPAGMLKGATVQAKELNDSNDRSIRPRKVVVLRYTGWFGIVRERNLYSSRPWDSIGQSRDQMNVQAYTQRLLDAVGETL